MHQSSLVMCMYIYLYMYIYMYIYKIHTFLLIVAAIHYQMCSSTIHQVTVQQNRSFRESTM